MSSTDAVYDSGQSRLRGVLNNMWIAPTVLAACGTLVLWLEAIGILPSIIGVNGPLGWERWGLWTVWAVIAGWLIAYLAYWLVPTRYRLALQSSTAQLPAVLLTLIVGASGIAIILGFSVYSRCTDIGIPFLSPMTWTLGLFVGIAEPELIGPSGVCLTEVPLAFHLARFAGVVATFSGALGVLTTLSRDQIARYRIRHSPDVDVVTGLSQLALPLVEALIDERQARMYREPWFKLKGRERFHRQRPTKVVVIHPQRDDPIASEVAVMGGVVIVGEPTDKKLLREVLTHKPRHRRLNKRRVMSLRRMYAVDADQNLNLAVHSAAEAALQTAARPDSSEVSTSEPVSRLVIRLDNAMEAREWRVAMVGRDRWFVDGFATDDLIADGIIRQLQAFSTEHLIIVGDTALSLTLLHYCNWLAWLNQELRLKNNERMLPVSHWSVPRITLAGERAERVLNEWQKISKSQGTLLEVCLASKEFGDWEEACHEYFEDDLRIAAVITLEGPEEIARATRLARLHKNAKVLCRDDNVEGVDAPFLGHDLSGFLVRFGPTVLQGVLRSRPGSKQATHLGRLSGKAAPEDTWTQIARILHLRWIPNIERSHDEDVRLAARKPWGMPGEPEKLRLPEFFREDTLRQIRQCLKGIQELGGRKWAPAERDAVGGLTRVEMVWLAKKEHERWCRYRVEAGWGSFEGIPNNIDDFTADELKLDTEAVISGDDNTIAETAEKLWKLRFEKARVNHNLRTWETGSMLGREVKDFPNAVLAEELQFDLSGLRLANISTIQFLLETLERWGLVPVEDMTDELTPVNTATPRCYQRVGFVRASRLDKSRQWRTQTGETLNAAAGDWWVEELIDDSNPQSEVKSGSGRSVKHQSFLETYIAHVADRFERHGNVVAYQALVEPEKIETQEGPATAQIGDWVVMDENGDSWPVPDVAFRVGYKPNGSDVRKRR